MSITVINPAQWQTQRWQNGGGITHQLCRQDNEAGLLWRVSIAEVASDGPFSRFEQLDRVILLLSGAGFCLHGVGDNPQQLLQPLQPFSFAGEAEVFCTLNQGAVRDFNLMTRRNALQAELKVLHVQSEFQAFSLSSITLCYVASGQVQICVNTQVFKLAAEQTLQLQDENGTIEITSDDMAQVIFIRLMASISQ